MSYSNLKVFLIAQLRLLLLLILLTQIREFGCLIVSAEDWLNCLAMALLLLMESLVKFQ